MKKNALVLFSFITILVFMSYACNSSSPTDPGSPSEPEPTPQLGTNFGDIAVDFTAKDQNGNNVSLYDYSGNVILVDMSADWCGPCRDEASHLEDLYDEYKQRGFQIITVLISGHPMEWANDYKLSFPVLDDNSEAIWNQYGEGYIPLNLVIDKDKVIRYKESGYDEAAIKAVIEKYL